MVLVSEVVGISWSHSLQVDDVTSLVGTFDTLNFNASCNLDLLSGSIDKFVYLDVHLFADLLHHLMELLVRLNSLLLINCAVLSQACQVRVIQDTWNDTLGDDTVAAVVDNSCRKVVQALDL